MLPPTFFFLSGREYTRWSTSAGPECGAGCVCKYDCMGWARHGRPRGTHCAQLPHIQADHTSCLTMHAHLSLGRQYPGIRGQIIQDVKLKRLEHRGPSALVPKARNINKEGSDVSQGVTQTRGGRPKKATTAHWQSCGHASRPRGAKTMQLPRRDNGLTTALSRVAHAEFTRQEPSPGRPLHPAPRLSTRSHPLTVWASRPHHHP